MVTLSHNITGASSRARSLRRCQRHVALQAPALYRLVFSYTSELARVKRIDPLLPVPANHTIQYFQKRIRCKRLPKNGLAEPWRRRNGRTKRCHHHDWNSSVLLMGTHRPREFGTVSCRRRRWAAALVAAPHSAAPCATVAAVCATRTFKRRERYQSDHSSERYRYVVVTIDPSRMARHPARPRIRDTVVLPVRRSRCESATIFSSDRSMPIDWPTALSSHRSGSCCCKPATFDSRHPAILVLS